MVVGKTLVANVANPEQLAKVINSYLLKFTAKTVDSRFYIEKNLPHKLRRVQDVYLDIFSFYEAEARSPRSLG